jgi:hypothetical protein
MAKVVVTDPDGAQWSVYRQMSFDVPRPIRWIGKYSDPNTAGDLLALGAAIWPFWFIAHWLGMRWIIDIERDGMWVGEENVRGWSESQRRIQEIARSAAAGTPPVPAEETALVGNLAGCRPRTRSLPGCPTPNSEPPTRYTPTSN